MLSLFIVPLVVATLPPQFHLASCVGPTDAADMRSRLSGVVEAALKRGDIPGVALSIVNRTSVLVEAGYGAANASSGRRMDADTLLPLGSTTKAFTSALLALLIDKYATDDKHRFNWSTPVRTLLGSSFQLYDEQLTTETTLEDILSHRTGIPDYFLLLLAGYPYHLTREQLIRSLRHHKPALPFREDYVYNNHMYVLAGYVAEVLENRSWEQLVSEYLLQPLGMTSTTFVRDVLMTRRQQMAVSCGWTEHGCAPVDLQVLDQVNVAAPAGAIVSTPRDMSRWMMWHLSGGTVPPPPATDNRPPTEATRPPARRRLIDKDRLWDTYRARNRAFSRHVDNEPTTSNASDRHVSYDLGWVTSFYRDERRVWHSGSISTYKAHVWLYPDAGIGIFAGLAGPQRYDTTDVFYDLMYAISDLVVFGIGPSPAIVDKNSSVVTVRPFRHAVDDQTPPRPLVDYTGTYVGRWLEMNATVILRQENRSSSFGGILRLTLGRMLTADLLRYDCVDDEFQAVIGGRLWWCAEGLPEQAFLRVRFRASAAGGRPDVLELPLEIGPKVADSLPARRFRFARPGVLLKNDWTAPDHGGDDAFSACSTASLVGPSPAWWAWFLSVFLCRVLCF